MLKLNIPDQEYFNEQTCKFIKVPSVSLQLEHSLISIKKWEARWHISFINTKEKTDEQLLDYIYCMCINNIDRKIFDTLPSSAIKEIKDYIADPMTATKIQNTPLKEGESPNSKKQILTAEVIYYYMIKLGIPIEFQKWHFNQLMTLIQVFGELDNKDAKKMNKKEAAAYRSALNAKRRSKMHSRG